MSNYRRLISYIYAYEGGIKGKNIGFAKIETRGIQCKITVSVKKVYVGGNDIGVYLLAGEQEILLGNIFIRGGSGEFRTVVSVSDVEHSGISMEQCYGLTVHDVENTWRSYTTIWEDAVTHAAEVELPDAVMAQKETEDGVQEAQIKRAMKEIEEEFPVDSMEERVPDSIIPAPKQEAAEKPVMKMEKAAGKDAVPEEEYGGRAVNRFEQQRVQPVIKPEIREEGEARQQEMPAESSRERTRGLIENAREQARKITGIIRQQSSGAPDPEGRQRERERGQQEKESRQRERENGQPVQNRPVVSAAPYIEPAADRSMAESASEKAPVKHTQSLSWNQTEGTGVFPRNLTRSVRSYSMAADIPAVEYAAELMPELKPAKANRTENVPGNGAAAYLVRPELQKQISEPVMVSEGRPFLEVEQMSEVKKVSEMKQPLETSGQEQAAFGSSFMDGTFCDTICYRADTANPAEEGKLEGESVVYPMYLDGMDGAEEDSPIYLPPKREEPEKQEEPGTAEPLKCRSEEEAVLINQTYQSDWEYETTEMLEGNVQEAGYMAGGQREAAETDSGAAEMDSEAAEMDSEAAEMGNEAAEMDSEGRSGQWEPLNPQELPEQQNFEYEDEETQQGVQDSSLPPVSSEAAEDVLPAPGDPKELERLLQMEEMEEHSGDQVWESLKRDHTKILDFDYEKGCEIVTIKPQDIGLLPRETWGYGNNSFLLHGYYNYRYLILAKLFNPEGEPRYLLGVPGHYYSNERYMASMFGFPSFVLSKNQPIEDGRFGYWYTDIKIGS